MRGKLFTIGHSQYKVEYFLSMLKNYNINYVVDVRSIPYSKFANNYNRENIKRILMDINIDYSFMGNYFGARPSDIKLYSAEGYVDFDKVKESSKFRQGLECVLKGIGMGNRIALMCTEKDPIDCHRSILVGNTFWENGIEVNHIISDITIQKHEELNERLKNIYFPERNQMSIFSIDNFIEEDYLKKSYLKQNKLIGYKLEKNVSSLITI